MIDWMHIGEVVIGNVFVAGVSYGAIRAELRFIRERVTTCESDIRAESTRIDNLILKGN